MCGSEAYEAYNELSSELIGNQEETGEVTKSVLQLRGCHNGGVQLPFSSMSFFKVVVVR